MSGIIELFTDRKKRQGEKPLNWGALPRNWSVKGGTELA